MRVLRGIVCGLLVGVTCLSVPATAAAQVHCTATIRLDDSVTLGALQLTIEYPHPTSAFDGGDASVDCTNATFALPNFQDDDAGTLTLAWVAFGSGFSGPGNMATCEMTNSVPIAESDLVVTVTDAGDANATPIQPRPAIVVSNIECFDPLAPTTTTTTVAVCGNGDLESGEECDDGNLDEGDGCDALCVEVAICGDADANLKVTTTDAQRVLRRAVGLPSQLLCN
jgi:cysteine-rich repeat protein